MKYLTELSRVQRRKPTAAERVLWKALRDRQFEGARFVRQKVIGRYIADFYCHASGLIVELDGSVHDEKGAVAYDAVRTEWLEALGLRVLRFRNEQVFSDLPSVLATIRALLPGP